MTKQKYATAMGFTGISLTTAGFMKNSSGLTFWLLGLSLVMLLTAAILEVTSEE